VARDRLTLIDAQERLREQTRETLQLLQENRDTLNQLAAGADAVAAHEQRLDLGTWVRGRVDHYLEKASPQTTSASPS
jgi:hypothetical protein